MPRRLLIKHNEFIRIYFYLRKYETYKNKLSCSIGKKKYMTINNIWYITDQNLRLQRPLQFLSLYALRMDSGQFEEEAFPNLQLDRNDKNRGQSSDCKTVLYFWRTAIFYMVSDLVSVCLLEPLGMSDTIRL